MCNIVVSPWFALCPCHSDLEFENLSGLYISETVRCRMLIPGKDIVRGSTCAMSWCDLDLTYL